MGFTNDVGIYVGLLAIALGKSSEDPILKEFLAYQLRGSHEDPILEEFLADQLRGSHEDPHAYEEKEVDCEISWRDFAWLHGMLILTLILGPEAGDASWGLKFLISIMVMGTSFLLFWFGFSFYRHQSPAESPLSICLRVFKAAISKRHLKYPLTPNQLYENDTGKIHLSPEVPFFR